MQGVSHSIIHNDDTLGKLVTGKPVVFVGFDNVVEFNDDDVVLILQKLI
jgi:4-hydroxy-3-methylbut-2-enyl diphosphate reductase IspH